MSQGQSHRLQFLTRGMGCDISRGMFFSQKQLVLLSPAKVNLTLEVLGRRADGYHDLRSVVCPVSLFDEVAFEPAPSGGVETITESDGVDLSALCSNDRNLATRAARLLLEENGVGCGVRIYIKKRIPVGGGLGGGSADAAAVLLGLNQVLNMGLSLEQLNKTGLRLGCDIPALITGGLTLMEGVGGRVRPIMPEKRQKSPIWLVIANPCVPVSTPEIYSLCRPPLTGAPNCFNNLVSPFLEGDVSAASRWLFNGLEAAVHEAYPEVRRLSATLRDVGALDVLLCGSGASVLGLARDREHAARMQLALHARGCAWSIVTKTLPDGVKVAQGFLVPLV